MKNKQKRRGVRSEEFKKKLPFSTSQMTEIRTARGEEKSKDRESVSFRILAQAIL